MKTTIQTSYSLDTGEIEQKVVKQFDSLLESYAVGLLRTRESEIRKALVALGWRPPINASILDHSISSNIPAEVWDAERTLTEFFGKRNVATWVFGGVCSRNFAEAITPP